jgi:two-component system phosphate regulon sensor histidine kinase PhoR
LEGISVPFTISRLEGGDRSHGLNEVVLGFANPVRYRLTLSETFPFLLRKLTLPILFSLFLVGISLAAFVLLYRNLVRQQRLANLKNDFISNITHELKTPIATMGVAIEALKNFNAINDTRKTSEYLDISQNELQRLSLLSMFGRKEMELKFEPVNLMEIAGEVVNSMRLQIEKAGGTVSLEAEGDTLVEGDRLHLVSVIFNLLDNALKYSREKPVINIRFSDSAEDVVLSMIDNGIGIPPEYRNRVFEKFFRVPTGNTHNAKGYGLGLSYARDVIRKHGGTIRVESEQGKGSSFILTIPKRQK